MLCCTETIAMYGVVRPDPNRITKKITANIAAKFDVKIMFSVIFLAWLGSLFYNTYILKEYHSFK